MWDLYPVAFAGQMGGALPSCSWSMSFHVASINVVGTNAGNTSDMREAIEMMNAGLLNPAAMITHIGGLDCVAETTLNLPNIPGGKKLIYNQISMPLTAIADFEKLGKDNELFAKLDELCKAHNGLWNGDAEKYLLSHFNVN